MRKIEDQPPPIVHPERVPVWDLVIADFRKHQREVWSPDQDPDPLETEIVADMRERDRLGRERYGTPLTTGNGRDHLVDAYQEQLDLIVYLRAWIEENPHTARHTKEGLSVRNLFREALRILYHLRWLMSELTGRSVTPDR